MRPSKEEDMAQPDIDTVLGWRGRTIVDRDGEKVGKFDEIYLDSRTDRPEWALVKMGLLGRDKALVPLGGAQEAGDDLQVPFEKAQIEATPDVDPESELSQDTEAELYRHYGIDYSDDATDTVMPRGETGGPEDPGADAGRTGATDSGVDPGRTGAADSGADAGRTGAADSGADPGPGAADTTRSEEEVRVGVEQRPRERVRLKKYVVTEHVTQTVPVQREEVRLEREPVSQEDGAPAADEDRGDAR
jgi:stress response protein YsnF